MATWQKIDVSSSTIFRTVLILLLFWFLYLIRDILVILFAAIVVSWAIAPIADYLQKFRVPRAVTVILVYLAALALLSGLITMMVPPLTAQVRSLAQTLPEVATVLEDNIPIPALGRETVVAQTQDFLAKFGDNLANISANIFQRTRLVFSGFLSVLFVFVITFYLVIEKEPIKKLLGIVLPKEHVPYAHRIVDKARRKIGRWVLAQLALGIIAGTIVGVGLWILGVPFALLLGVIAGVFEIVPVIGPVLAAIPGVVVGVSQGWILGLAALGLYWGFQQLENNLLVPRIMKRAVGLNPLVTLIAVLLGARLAGVAGLILAVPAATVISVFLSDIFADKEELAG